MATTKEAFHETLRGIIDYAESALLEDYPPEWLDTLQENALSATGYLYGIVEAPEEAVKGFELGHLLQRLKLLRDELNKIQGTNEAVYHVDQAVDLVENNLARRGE